MVKNIFIILICIISVYYIKNNSSNNNSSDKTKISNVSIEKNQTSFNSSLNKEKFSDKTFQISKVEEPLVLIQYSKHSIILNKGLKLPIYESHFLIKKELLNRKNYKRPPFIQDPTFKQFTYKTNQYNRTGFDRGHIFSAESASVNPTAYMECFYTTNIIPQNPQLNRGEWKKKEEFARKEAENSKNSNDSIQEINLFYKFEQNKKFSVPRFCTKILIYKDKSIKYWTFDNFKNSEVQIPLDSIQILWNIQNRIQFKK